MFTQDEIFSLRQQLVRLVADFRVQLVSSTGLSPATISKFFAGKHIKPTNQQLIVQQAGVLIQKALSEREQLLQGTQFQFREAA